MASKVVEICKKEIQPVIEKMGYEVVDIEFAKKSDGWNLSFFIDCEHSIQIEDCEKVHKEINVLLDNINPTNDSPYILNVCSPGLDRPLKTERDFKKNIDCEVVLKFYKAQNKQKEITGILKGFDDLSVTLEVNAEVQKILKKEIALIVPKIKI